MAQEININTIRYFKNNSINHKKAKYTFKLSESVRFKEAMLYDDDIKIICQIVKKSKFITEIEINQQKKIGSTKDFFKNLKNSSSNIRNFKINCCCLSKKNVKNICKLFSGCKMLQTIHFNAEYEIGVTEYPIFKILKKSSKYLRHLSFSNCNLNEENIKNLTKLIKKQCLLQTVNFHLNKNIGVTDVPIFECLLNSSQFLENLNFSNCKLNEKNIINVFRLIAKCSHLKAVDLSFNDEIGKMNCEIFSSLSNSSSTLETIDFSHCDLNNENIENFSNLFSICNNLKSVNLSYNSKISSTNHPIIQNLFNSSSSSLENVKLLGINLG